jgi:hypothetical protein
VLGKSKVYIAVIVIVKPVNGPDFAVPADVHIGAGGIKGALYKIIKCIMHPGLANSGNNGPCINCNAQEREPQKSEKKSFRKDIGSHHLIEYLKNMPGYV